MLKELFKLASKGISIGIIITLICLSTAGIDNTLKQVIVWCITSALYGIVSYIFENDTIPLPIITIIHMVVCAVLTLATSYYLGYSHSISELAIHVLPIFIIVYVVIYTVMFISERKKAKSISNKLNKVQ